MAAADEWDAGWLSAVARGDAAPDIALRGGTVLSVHTREWLAADVLIASGRIAGVVERPARSAAPIFETDPHGAVQDVDVRGRWIVPGYIDAHVHIESSKLTADGFAAAVVPRGTAMVVAEPHEIANVLGVDGTTWFMDSVEDLPLDVRFMVPSCVPASRFESTGAFVGVSGMEALLEHPRALGVGELMNFPGIIAGDPGELAKVASRGSSHADGHAPGVVGRELDAYVAAGITSDHEATTYAEALEKRRRGMWVLMREASNARNLRDLLPLVRDFGPEFCAFCTDDREPDFLLREGHIDQMLRIAVAEGVDPVHALLMATLHPALAHRLTDVGALVPGARAHVNVLPDLESFVPDEVYVDGRLVAAGGRMRAACGGWAPSKVRDTVRIAPLADDSFRIAAPIGALDGEAVEVRVVGAREGQLLTDVVTARLPVHGGEILAAPDLGVAKLAVVERHTASGRIGTGFVSGFGLRSGAFASSVAHDAHNIVVVGADDASMRTCVEHLAQIGGGIACAVGGEVAGTLALPVAGLMSDRSVGEVAESMDELHDIVSAWGVGVEAPFMILSFLALSVIPSLKLTDRGYVDVDSFQFVPLLTDTAENRALVAGS